MSKSRIFSNSKKGTGKEEFTDKYREYIFKELKEKENITLEEALDQMYDSLFQDVKDVKKQVAKVIRKCNETIEKQFNDIHKIYPDITKDEA